MIRKWRRTNQELFLILSSISPSTVSQSRPRWVSVPYFLPRQHIELSAVIRNWYYLAILNTLKIIMVENGGSTVFFTRFAFSDNILYMMYICFIFQTIPNELPVVRREYKNGMYSTFPYFVSKVISELPYVFGLPFLTMAVCYFMIGGFFNLLVFLTKAVCYTWWLVCFSIFWLITLTQII